MKSNILFFAICCLSLVSESRAQTISGFVKGASGEYLIGATVQWQGAPFGVTTAEDGSFMIEKVGAFEELIISYVGYRPDTISYEAARPMPWQIVLEESQVLSEVEVTADGRDSYVSMLEVTNTQVVSKQEFRKAACCNLAESFENNASVDLMNGNAVMGTKEIEMLGLRGLYTQFLLEGRPMATGINGPEILNMFAGTWLEQLQVAKGATTVSQGYQPIAGSINAELFKPLDAPRLFVNLYGASSGRMESNLHLNTRWNARWSSGLALHASTLKTKWDRNDDGFLDLPLKEQYMALFRTFYRGTDLNAQFNILATRDLLEAGQRLGDADLERPYLVDMEKNHLELFGKLGYIGFSDPNRSMALTWALAAHELRGQLGERDYAGTQKSAYAQLMYLDRSADEWHEWRGGLSFQYEDADERFTDFRRPVKEVVPGAYVEYSYAPKVLPCAEEGTDNFGSRIGASAGIRVDQHNQFGWLVSPKANLKYFLTENTVLRLAGGLGYRTPYVIAENLGQLVSNRALVVADDIGIEKASNVGLNITQSIKSLGESASLSLDVYRTDFSNQAVVDMDVDSRLLQIRPLEGRSFASNALLLFQMEPIHGMNAKVAYKWTDTRMTTAGQLQQRPLLPEHRALASVDYETSDKKWLFNATCQWIGEQRLADLSGVSPEDLNGIPQRAPDYFLLFAHIEYAPGKFQYYLGLENLLDYRQKSAIIGAKDPYDGTFDAGQVYAPIFGRNVYLGMRFTME